VPRPLALVVKEGIEDAIDLLREYTVTGVGNRHLDAFFGSEVTRHDGDGASFIHGLNGIHEDVHEHLLELRSVRQNARQVRSQVLDQADIEKQRLFGYQRQGVLEDLVEVHQLGVALGLPREFEQALHNVPASLGLADDLLEVFAVGIVIPHVFDGEGRQRQDAAQRIIDFMRHPGRQHTEGSQPLRLGHPGLHRHQLLGALPHLFLERPAPFLQIAPHLPEALEHGVEGFRQ